VLLAILVTACSAEPAAVEADPNPSEAQLVHQFRQLWHGDKSRVMSNQFLGIPTLQNPLDVWVTQEIISEVKPDVIVETGTYQGGSSLLWAILLTQMKPEGRVITVDIHDKRSPLAVEHPVAREHVEFLLGSSVAPEVVARVEEEVRGKKALFILDAAHTEDHVMKELEAFAPMVSPGSYIIVQDTALGGSRAIDRFLESDPGFEIDATRERYILTNNLRGFLKRVR